MTANYHRMSVRFRDPETRRKLALFKKKLERETGKPVSESHLLELIAQQFLEKNLSLEEEKETNSLALKTH